MLAQLADADARLQQQWHDLVMAEQAGKPTEVLEQMYETYLLLAEEFNQWQQIEADELPGERERTPLAVYSLEHKVPVYNVLINSLSAPATSSGASKSTKWPAFWTTIRDDSGISRNNRSPYFRGFC
jgi:hypothetical protein